MSTITHAPVLTKPSSGDYILTIAGGTGVLTGMVLTIMGLTEKQGTTGVGSGSGTGNWAINNSQTVNIGFNHGASVSFATAGPSVGVWNAGVTSGMVNLNITQSCPDNATQYINASVSNGQSAGMMQDTFNGMVYRDSVTLVGQNSTGVTIRVDQEYFPQSEVRNSTSTSTGTVGGSHSGTVMAAIGGVILVVAASVLVIKWHKRIGEFLHNDKNKYTGPHENHMHA
jgi:hypothetical protein